MKKQDIELLKQECRARGMVPTEIPIPQISLTKEKLNDKLAAYNNILDITSYFLNEFVHSLEDTPLLTTIADSEGNIISIQGNETIKSMVEAAGIKQGVQFTEEHCGMNVVNLVLRYKRPISIIGEDHYHNFLQQTACYGVPVIDHEANEIVAVIAIMTSKDFTNSVLLSLLSSVNNSIEREVKLVKEKDKLNIINEIIIDTTYVGILIVDKNGIIIDFNTYAQKKTGISKEAIVGKPFRDTVWKYASYLEDVLYRETRYMDEEITYTVEGQDLTFLCDALPIFYRGEIIGAFIQFRDITEQVRSKEYLLKAKLDAEEANHEKTNFISNMSHELRTPLNAIHGFSHVLEMDVDHTLTVDEKMYVKEICSASKHMLTIVNDLMDFSEVEAGHINLNMRYVNLNTLVQECIKMVEHGPSKSIKIFNEIENQPSIKVRVDYTRLKQVVLNLISNAAKYNVDGGCIWVRCKVNDEIVELSVKDSGIGIDPEELGSVFNKFYRTSQSRNIIEGSGVGLAVAKRLLEKMGGNISVESVLDEGSTFTIQLKNPEILFDDE